MIVSDTDSTESRQGDDILCRNARTTVERKYEIRMRLFFHRNRCTGFSSIRRDVFSSYSTELSLDLLLKLTAFPFLLLTGPDGLRSSFSRLPECHCHLLQHSLVVQDSLGTRDRPLKGAEHEHGSAKRLADGLRQRKRRGQVCMRHLDRWILSCVSLLSPSGIR